MMKGMALLLLAIKVCFSGTAAKTQSLPVALANTMYHTTSPNGPRVSRQDACTYEVPAECLQYLSSPDNTSNDQDSFARDREKFCTSNCANPVLEYYRQCSSLHGAEFLAQFCGRNSNGDPCYSKIVTADLIPTFSVANIGC